MHNILKEIIEKKREDLQMLNKEEIHEKALKLRDKKGYSLKEALLNHDAIGVIAEIKRASPSKGALNLNLNPQEMARKYSECGAAGISVLTEARYFKGSYKDLADVRRAVEVPILNKDFFIDKAQIDLCKIYGGDVILLILKALPFEEAKDLLNYAHYLNLEVLMEVHNKDEFIKAKELQPDIIGINNRNLETFEVSLKNTLSLSEFIKEENLVISESGIGTREEVTKLKEAGVKGILVGESFVTSKNLGNTFNELKL